MDKIKKSPQKTKLENEEKDKYDSKSTAMQNISLIKYDTPFLVSTTISDKKKLEELDENNEQNEIFLRNLIYKRGGDDTKQEDCSVKDALNKILPPKRTFENDQLWVQYVSCTPVTKVEVLNLQEGLDRRLQTSQARETGICPIREQLYNECFDELIRQVTINCLERGILLMRIKKEVEMTVNSYQSLYESAIAYGIRTALISEEAKAKMDDQSKRVEDECEYLEDKIKKLEKDIELITEQDEKKRKEENEKHDKLVKEYREKNNKLKEDIKIKLSNALNK